MHPSRTSLASLAAVAFLAGSASAQCWTYPIPQAPDMRGPGYYMWNCQGQLYGPYHNVTPWFGPHQGFIPGPQAAQGQASAMQSYQKHGMMPGYVALQRQQQQYQQQQQQQNPGGYPGMWFHPNVRSPRDFFMYGEDPAASPYRFGGAGGSPSTTDRVTPPSR